MLTIKQVKSSGSEQVLEIKSVEYAANDKNDWKNRKLTLEFPDGHNEIRENHGTFYVMNEKGHTISKYFLGPDKEELKFLKEASI